MALLDLAEVTLPLDESFSVKIINYKVIQEGQYVLYTILVALEPYTWTIERRYSDFAAFDKLRFRDRRKSFLPKKKMRGNLDSEFIEERRIDLEKYLKSVLELHIWYQKQKNLTSLPLLFARFLDFHQYEVHSIVDDLCVRLSRVGEAWLNGSLSSPKYFEFTPIELHAVGRRMQLAEANSSGRADIVHLMEFLHGVRSLRVRGCSGYVFSSSIVSSSLSMSLIFCKSLLALWLTDCNAESLHDLEHLHTSLRSLTIHYSLQSCREILAPTSQSLQIQSAWTHLENVDLSFNQVECLDESLKLLSNCTHLSLAHNRLSSIGRWLTFLPSLSNLDLSGNNLESVDRWHENIGNVKRLNLARNRIKDLNGLSRVYSLEQLDISDNEVCESEKVAGLGRLPCLQTLVLEGNPLCQRADYRIKVLQHFEDRATELVLDGRTADDRERDTVGVRIALSRAAAERERRL